MMSPKRSHFVSVSLVLAAVFLVSGCGKPKANYAADITPADSESPLRDPNLPEIESLGRTELGADSSTHAQAPTNAPATAPATVPAVVPVTPGLSSDAVTQAALRFAQSIKIPLFIRFPAVSFSEREKADWFVAPRCVNLLERMSCVAASAINIYPLVPTGMCNEADGRAKAKITLVSNRYIARKTATHSHELLLRGDLSVGALKMVTNSGTGANRTTIERIVVSDRTGVAESIIDKDSSSLKFKSLNGAMTYHAVTRKTTARAGAVATKIFTHLNYGGQVLSIIERVSPTQTECSITIVGKDNRVVSDSSIARRCFHQSAEAVARP